MDEGFPDAQLFAVWVADEHFANIIQLFSTGTTLEGYTTQQKKELVVRVAEFSIIVGHLYKMGSDEVSCRYVPYYEKQSILTEWHGGVVGGHYAGRETT